MVKGVWLRPSLYPKVFRYVRTSNRQGSIKNEEEAAAAAAKGKKNCIPKKKWKEIEENENKYIKLQKISKRPKKKGKNARPFIFFHKKHASKLFICTSILGVC